MGYILNFRNSSRHTRNALSLFLTLPMIMLMNMPTFAVTPTTEYTPTCRLKSSTGKVTGNIVRRGSNDNVSNIQFGGWVVLDCQKGAEIRIDESSPGYPSSWTNRFPSSAWEGEVTFSVAYTEQNTSGNRNQNCFYRYNPLNPSAGYVLDRSQCDVADSDGKVLQIGSAGGMGNGTMFEVRLITGASSLTLRSDDEDAHETFEPYIIDGIASVPRVGRIGGVDLRLATNPNACGNPSAFEISYPKEALIFKRAIGASSTRAVNETLSFRIGVKYNRLDTSAKCNRKIEPKVTFSLGEGGGNLLDDNIHIDLKEVGLLLSLQASSGRQAYKDVVFGKATSLVDIPLDKHRVMRYTNFIAKLTRNPQRRLTPGEFNQIVLAEIEYD